MREKIEKSHCFSLKRLFEWPNGCLKYADEKLENIFGQEKLFEASDYDNKIQKHWNQVGRIHNDFVCKFLIWPPIVMEAIAVAILFYLKEVFKSCGWETLLVDEPLIHNGHVQRVWKLIKHHVLLA